MGDVYESIDKQREGEATRPPLVPAEKINGINRRVRTREIGSRYKSPTPGPRRFPSPSITRTDRAPLLPKRSLSAERKRPTTPPSPKNLSTPVHESSLESQFGSRKVIGSRFAESLWPSTMRSLSVSLQCGSKRETMGRKPVSERKKTPTRGSSYLDQVENSKPVESRVIEQNRWPGRIGGKMSSNFLSKSIDLSDRVFRTPVLGRRTAVFDDENGRPQTVSRTLSACSRPSSPTRGPIPPASLSRGISPSRTRSSATLAASRGVSPSRIRSTSPSRIRPTSPSCQTASTSVLSFTADFRRGKKAANMIEDAHQLKLLYNRHLQWRYINSRTDYILHTHEHTAENSLYNASHAISELRDSVSNKRIHLQHLKLIRKLRSLLDIQMVYLDDWDIHQKAHTDALCSFIDDLQWNTLRLPVTTGAVVDVDRLELALCSAENVMQAMQSSLSAFFTRAEEVNHLISELTDITNQNRSLLHECEALLTSTSSMQIGEYSLRTLLLQMKKESGR